MRFDVCHIPSRTCALDLSAGSHQFRCEETQTNKIWPPELRPICPPFDPTPHSVRRHRPSLSELLTLAFPTAFAVPMPRHRSFDDWSIGLCEMGRGDDGLWLQGEHYLLLGSLVHTRCGELGCETMWANEQDGGKLSCE